MAVLAFIRNVTSLFECLKIKILEYSDPPLQQFSIPKASISNFVLCRKVTLCQSGRMAHYRLAHFVCMTSILFSCSYRFQITRAVGLLPPLIRVLRVFKIDFSSFFLTSAVRPFFTKTCISIILKACQNF